MTEVNKMTWVNLFIYSCHLILLIDSGHVVYWLESCHLLAQVMPFIDFSHAIYWLESFYLLTRVILFIGLSHFIYWLESFYFWSAALRTRNGSPPAYNAIHSCAWGKLFRHTKSGVRAIFGSATGSGKNRVCREAQYHHDGLVDISTTNASIEDRTKGDDSLRCNLPSRTV